MSPKLNSSISIHRLAADLGLRPTENPVQVILAYCHRSVKKFLAEHGHCAGLGELLNLLASKLGTRIIETNDSDQLRKVQHDYVNRGEKIFATLEQELADDDCYGITFRLQNPELWELHHVSIIDCRGQKRYRRYHTKWHEIGHLLILTDQTRLAFRRTHDLYQPKSAEESLVDAIAGEFSFYRSIIAPALTGQISFEKIEQIRATYCPEASVYSAILNVSKLWPTPCIWVEARLAGRKSDPPRHGFINLGMGAYCMGWHVRKRPPRSVKAVVLVNEYHAIPEFTASLHKNGLTFITIAHPFVEGEHPHEVHTVHDPIEL